MSHINPAARKLFKRIAQQQWHRLGKGHKLGLDRAEIGITDDVIYQIVRYVKRNPGSGIEVWKSRHESRNGHDIDLFVRDSRSSGFYWFPLQAKVLDCNQRYAHIAPGGKKGQWPLLQRLQRNALGSGIFCQPYYLWYTGFTARTAGDYLQRWQGQVGTELAVNPALTITDLMPRWRAAFGCSLTPPDVVQTVCASHIKPWYHHFHNRKLVREKQTFAWHHLFDYRFAQLLPKTSAGHPFTWAELQGRQAFYRRTAASFAPKANDPVSYYYYINSEETTPPDEPENFGRYMILIDRLRLVLERMAALGQE
jgi:hypothetical protein